MEWRGGNGVSAGSGVVSCEWSSECGCCCGVTKHYYEYTTCRITFPLAAVMLLWTSNAPIWSYLQCRVGV
jgi:hypothetical protein